MSVPVRVLPAMGVGAALGVVASWADWYAGRQYDAWGWLALDHVVNAGSVWACVAILGGWLVGRLGTGWLGGVLALMTAVAGYYIYGNLFGDRLGYGWTTLGSVVKLWLAAAVLLGPVLGTIGALARRGDAWGLTARLVPSVGALTEMGVVRGVGRSGDEAGTMAVVVVSAAALAWAVVVVLRWRLARRAGRSGELGQASPVSRDRAETPGRPAAP